MIEPIPDRLEKTLRETLGPNERVFIKLRGAFKEALVCTDSRVIILKGGWMTGQLFGTDTFQCPYANIAGAEVKFHLLTGYFELSAGGMQNTPKSFWQAGNKPVAAKAPNCVSLAGPEQAKHAFKVEGRIPVFTTRAKAQAFLDIHAPGNEKRLVTIRAAQVPPHRKRVDEIDAREHQPETP